MIPRPALTPVSHLPLHKVWILSSDEYHLVLPQCHRNSFCSLHYHLSRPPTNVIAPPPQPQSHYSAPRPSVAAQSAATSEYGTSVPTTLSVHTSQHLAPNFVGFSCICNALFHHSLVIHLQRDLFSSNPRSRTRFVPLVFDIPYSTTSTPDHSAAPPLLTSISPSQCLVLYL